MKPISGINRDNSPIDQPQGTMRYAANGIISETTGVAQNIRDDFEFDTNLPAGFTMHGWVLGDHHVYVFGKYSTLGNQGEIWRFDPDVPNSAEQVIIDPSDFLDFDTETSRLQFVYQEDFESHEVFAWVGDTKPRIIDIGKIIADKGWVSGDAAISLSAEGYTKNDFLLFPEGELYNPKTTIINSGGNVSSGSWMFMYRYVYEDGATTNWSGVSNPVYIPSDSLENSSFSIHKFEGDPGNVGTNKSIDIEIVKDDTQSDSTFIQIGYISIREGVIFAGMLNPKNANDLSPSAGLIRYIYSGELPFIDLGNEILELITPKAMYTHAQTITSLTSKIYLANLKTKDEENMQSIANDIAVGWQYKKGFSGDLLDNPFDKAIFVNKQTFGFGEVYALYISALYSDGTESRAFHIPGRKFKVGDDALFSPTGEVSAGEKWTIADTVTSGVNANFDYEGETGYWVNKNELYPSEPSFDSAIDTGSPYANNVRHHKLPSLGYLINQTSLSPYLNVPSLDFVFSNINLDTLSENVIGYNIHYAKRGIGDFINLSYEWPNPCGIGLDFANDMVAIASNHAYSDRATGAYDASILTDVIPTAKALRFHSLYLLKDNPSIHPAYLVKEAAYVDSGLNGWTRVDSDKYTDSAGSDTAVLSSAYKYGLIGSIKSNEAVVSYPEEDRYVKIDDYKYIKNGVNLNGLNNNAGEDAFVIFSENGSNGASVETGYFNGPDSANAKVVIQTPAPADTGTLGLYLFGSSPSKIVLTLCALRAIPSGISLPFSSQTMVFLKSFEKEAGAVTSIVEGALADVYNGMSQWNTTGVAGTANDPITPTEKIIVDTSTDEAGVFRGEGSKVSWQMPIQSPINHVMQYAKEAQSWTAPVGGDVGGFRTTGNFSDPYDESSKRELKGWYCYYQNIYESMLFYYSNDYHKVSEYFVKGIENGSNVLITKAPTTIAVSLAQASDSQIRHWRDWRLENKFVQPSEKGEIINLQGAGNQMLYIHHRHSLYTTKDRLTLEGTANVTIGSSNIFEVTPYEIVSVTEGHTGIENKHWQSLTPFGYSWIQSDHGKVYSHNGKDLNEMSGRGLRVYFRDTIQALNNGRDECFTIINDDLRRRVIVGMGIASTNNDFRTIDYSTTGDFWSFWQDNRMNYPIVSRDKRVFLWSNVGQDIYSLAEGNYNNSARPFIIEPVFTDGTSLQKYLQSISWNTNVYVSNVDQEFETFNKLIISSDTKIYGSPVIDPVVANGEWSSNLIPSTGFRTTNANMRRLEDNWSTNNFRDLWNGSTSILRDEVDNIGPNTAAINTGKLWHQKSRMRDKYFIIRLIYDKANSNKFEVESVTFGNKNSIR